MSRIFFPMGGLLALLSGCSLFFPVRQDPETIRALNDLKPAIRRLYESFKAETVVPGHIAAVRDQWDAVIAREKGKGDSNSLMQGQVAGCRDMFEAHIRNRMEGPSWSFAHHDNQLENMLETIELAIRTELSKTP